MDANSSFNPVFSALRSILAEYEPGLDIIADEPGYYYLNTRTLGPNKHPISFGGVRIGKAYVSYYLMCAYAGNAQLGMSPALKRRMQGKACFNFKSVDPELFDELRTVTRTGYEAWKKLGWVG
jgi:hypothetical protein